MANPLMGILSGFGGGNGGGSNILMQAAGAFMRGESPRDFLRNLANTTPELRGMDLSDINAAAHKLCQERGIDEAQLTAKIKDTIESFK